MTIAKVINKIENKSDCTCTRKGRELAGKSGVMTQVCVECEKKLCYECQKNGYLRKGDCNEIVCAECVELHGMGCLQCSASIRRGSGPKEEDQNHWALDFHELEEEEEKETPPLEKKEAISVRRMSSGKPMNQGELIKLLKTLSEIVKPLLPEGKVNSLDSNMEADATHELGVKIFQQIQDVINVIPEEEDRVKAVLAITKLSFKSWSYEVFEKTQLHDTRNKEATCSVLKMKELILEELFQGKKARLEARSRLQGYVYDENTTNYQQFLLQLMKYMQFSQMGLKEYIMILKGKMLTAATGSTENPKLRLIYSSWLTWMNNWELMNTFATL